VVGTKLNAQEYIVAWKVNKLRSEKVKAFVANRIAKWIREELGIRKPTNGGAKYIGRILGERLIMFNIEKYGKEYTIK